jgi:epoxyqueuosine reductase
MDFMRRDAKTRQDIRRWYPAAKSVLVCGFAYDGGERPAADAEHGHIARYAAHEDYHSVLRLRLEQVLRWWRQSGPEADGRIFVDSSPVLEKLYGYHAGLGWIGRNCLLISQEIGSYFLLAGIALNRELEPDRPAADHCGGCRACLDACPSTALLPDRVLDASRCTAYLTIEARGPIPESRSSGMGHWLAGCDLCQDACPWNRKRRAGILKPLLPLEIPLSEAADVSPEGWERRFQATPIARLKRQGLARNASLALAENRRNL